MKKKEKSPYIWIIGSIFIEQNYSVRHLSQWRNRSAYSSNSTLYSYLDLQCIGESSTVVEEKEAKGEYFPVAEK